MAYESLNLRVSEEGKENLVREVARRRKAGQAHASQSTVVDEWLRSLGEPQAKAPAKR